MRGLVREFIMAHNAKTFQMIFLVFVLSFGLSGCAIDTEAIEQAVSEGLATVEQSASTEESASAEESVSDEQPGGGELSAQPNSCPSGVQFLAGSFGTEAQWVSYQGVLQRDVATLTEFWQAHYSVIGGDGSFPGVCNVVEYEPQSAPYLNECGLDSETASQNAFYCPGANAVMWDGPGFYHPIYTELGDAALTFITAHEFGHAAQVQSGTLPDTSVNAELQADCYAGAYLQYASQQGQISRDDADEVVRIVLMVGQSRIGSTWQTRTHGTSLQRQLVVKRGFTEGVEGCINVDFEQLINEIDRDDIDLPVRPGRR